MKEKVRRFKGYSEKAFWVPLIGQMVDTMKYASVISGGDVKKRQEIMSAMGETIYAMYSSKFNRHEFNLYCNQVIQSVIDAVNKNVKNNKNVTTTGDILGCLKKNWTKHYKYMP